ncbi:16S rRNA (guanine(966)-N(2))-methyltransferase RsmD [Thetidibacter halocola]|uniref:16S rRNA (Guanine(966)-N(2))-methyltransferase RsmD n=1 Tax=Thetidibacter halocola TaxID=2827239 RepID=A0A8J7WFX7_9RHOB|nr:16S rRNA (guanine(966)-N(2))-methyltransferase RsmD [Thetidibacter halocola]
MRIVAGEFRGRRLVEVGKGDEGAHLRPTTDRVREALMGTLSGGRYGDPFEGAHVLDLFAGTGALGLEALSRGASHVTFVDDGRIAQTLIRQNVAALQVTERVRLLTRSALKLPPTDDPAHLVFLDPPYGKGLGAKALASAEAGGWLASESLIVWEESAPQEPPPGFILIEHRSYGDTVVTLLQAP